MCTCIFAAMIVSDLKYLPSIRNTSSLVYSKSFYQLFAIMYNICVLLQTIGKTILMNKKNSIAKWISYHRICGESSFTIEDLRTDFPDMNPPSISRSISREIKKKNIMSPWKGFYVIVPTEYMLKGIVPQYLYIDKLMAYLKKNYYVSLLNAAQLHGASHQLPMAFFVTIESPALRDKINKRYVTHFVVRNSIPSKFVERRTVSTGWINYSSPELTAVDIITYRHNIGGLDRASTLLAELSENLHFDKLDKDYSEIAPLASFQRLGYILEVVLENKKVADDLYNLVMKSNEPKRYVPLKSNAGSKGYSTNKRWKIIENFKIEIDDV